MSLAELLAECITEVDGPYMLEPDLPTADDYKHEADWLIANRDRVLAALGGTREYGPWTFDDSFGPLTIAAGESVWVFGATP